MLLMVRELIDNKLGMTGSDSTEKADGADEPNVNTPPSSVVLKAESNNVATPAEPSGTSQQEEEDDAEMLIT
jgi:hypothetical protein